MAKRRPPRPPVAADAELPPSYAALRDRIQQAFSFLVRDHGYEPPALIFRFPELALRYVRGDRGVDISSQYFGEPWVQVRPPDPDQRFGLDEAIEALSPATWAEHPPRRRGALALDEAGAWVDFYARFLRAHPHLCLDDASAAFAAVERLRASRGDAAD